MEDHVTRVPAGCRRPEHALVVFTLIIVPNALAATLATKADHVPTMVARAAEALHFIIPDQSFYPFEGEYFPFRGIIAPILPDNRCVQHTMSAHTRPRRFAHTIFRNTSSKVKSSERSRICWRVLALLTGLYSSSCARKCSATTVRFWCSPPVRVDRELQQRDRTDAFAGHFRYTAFVQGTDAASFRNRLFDHFAQPYFFRILRRPVRVRGLRFAS